MTIFGMTDNRFFSTPHIIIIVSDSHLSQRPVARGFEGQLSEETAIHGQGI
jgi:hypothetical protein